MGSEVDRRFFIKTAAAGLIGLAISAGMEGGSLVIANDIESQAEKDESESFSSSAKLKRSAQRVRLGGAILSSVTGLAYFAVIASNMIEKRKNESGVT